MERCARYRTSRSFWRLIARRSTPGCSSAGFPMSLWRGVRAGRVFVFVPTLSVVGFGRLTMRPIIRLDSRERFG